MANDEIWHGFTILKIAHEPQIQRHTATRFSTIWIRNSRTENAIQIGNKLKRCARFHKQSSAKSAQHLLSPAQLKANANHFFAFIRVPRSQTLYWTVGSLAQRLALFATVSKTTVQWFVGIFQLFNICLCNTHCNGGDDCKWWLMKWLSDCEISKHNWNYRAKKLSNWCLCQKSVWVEYPASVVMSCLFTQQNGQRDEFHEGWDCSWPKQYQPLHMK